jgi:metallo-beta-lactamase class B
MMTGSIRLAAGLLVALSVAAVGAQQPPPQPAKPDSPAVVQQIAKLKEAAGSRWADTVRFWCEAPRANRADDPAIEPVRIFDNVYAIGSIGTVAYVIRTSAGLMMIDALSPDELETKLLPGFAKLGLDPAQVKIVLVGHGHADHFGGAGYFQQKFGARVYVAGADWDLMETPARGRGPAPAPTVAPPKRDGELQDGAAITLGDVAVRAVAVPGHTPGSMGFIFPVVDRGERHVAALYGGSWLTPGFLNDEAMRTYITSVSRFREATKAAGVDAWLQNHPLMVPFQDWLTRVAARGRTDPNPFVVGAGGYQGFLDVMTGCSQVALERRKP